MFLLLFDKFFTFFSPNFGPNLDTFYLKLAQNYIKKENLYLGGKMAEIDSFTKFEKKSGNKNRSFKSSKNTI